ncbi:class I ribonucleotide reductase maintenance protein YfaE [Vibrio sp. SS-MA-C1-2]|uniref:class I ribonucleotide reductase maintenance protein YfaE n=1 Tax=Vibrio sp. SS-MA-C1-2 TaxID=2908646 RepID=UPI001F366606|nr:class I ribonucleotide reductase maintenance protein YfaE [Vibrio sp. SS-MA-C1-2]UJF19956.1 class I ribonucleotide reductase maintenance protein YfaE [Vibrio sp. SS-MA-C1-2]
MLKTSVILNFKMPVINVKGSNFNTSGNKTILEVLEVNQVQIESQCREGFCGACRCKLIKGEVKYINEPIAFLKKGEFLACSTIPSCDIVIEI